MLLSGDQIISDRNPLDDRWYGAGTQLSLTGIKVDQNNALKLSTVWACTRILSATIACLPVKVMKRTPNGPVVVSDHPVTWCMDQWPNNDMGPKTFRATSTPQQVNAGNCFAEIERFGDSVHVWPIHHSRVSPVRRKADGALAWSVKNDCADPTFLMDADVLHVKSHMSWDGIMGMGIIEHARETIGFGLALEREGASRFANAARPEVVIEGGKFQNDEARQFYRTTWAERHAGYQNRGKPAMLPTDAKLHVIEFSAVDQQFIESSQFGVEQICRWYGVPPHMVQHLLRATFSNIEWMGQDFVTYSLLPWIGMWEEEIDRKLLGKAKLQQGFYSRFDVNELMRGDSAARSAFYDRMVNQIGALNPNEVRAMENLPGLGPAGDKYRAPLNMTTLDKLGESPPKPVDGKLIPRPKPGGQEEIEEAEEEDDTKEAKPEAGLSSLVAAAWTAALESMTDVARVMVRQEVAKCQSAARHPDKFIGAVEEFYGKHVERMTASLSKPAAVLAVLAARPIVVDGPITAHCEQARVALLDASDCQPEQLEETVNAVLRKWDTRAGELIERIINPKEIVP
jgi:HK97 family phage portal protein